MITRIEIRPHIIGYRSTPEGTEDVASDEFAVLLADYDAGKMRQVGYLWYKPKIRVTCECYSPTDAEKASLMDLIEQETGLKAEGFGMFPKLIEDDEEEEEDDTEDE